MSNRYSHQGFFSFLVTYLSIKSCTRSNHLISPLFVVHTKKTGTMFVVMKSHKLLTTQTFQTIALSSRDRLLFSFLYLIIFYFLFGKLASCVIHTIIAPLQHNRYRRTTPIRLLLTQKEITRSGVLQTQRYFNMQVIRQSVQ